jgi:hypothetical protein
VKTDIADDRDASDLLAHFLNSLVGAADKKPTLNIAKICSFRFQFVENAKISGIGRPIMTRSRKILIAAVE